MEIKDAYGAGNPLGNGQDTLFPKITDKYNALIKGLRKEKRLGSAAPVKFDLRGTVKLHGAHADIVVDIYNDVRFQSRNRTDVTPETDVYGFATWGNQIKQAAVNLKQEIIERYFEIYPNGSISKGPIILAGEWIGDGVQKDVAISRLSKRWVLVNISLDGGKKWEKIEDYADIAEEGCGIYNIMRSGGFRESVSSATLEADKERIQAITNEVERECPFGKVLGARGTGEGIVWRVVGFEHDSRFWLKTKGSMFSTTGPRSSTEALSLGTSMPIPPRPKRTMSPGAFVRGVLNVKRLQQGWDYMGEMWIRRDAKGLEEFVNWVTNDIFVEEKWEIAEYRLDKEALREYIGRVGTLYYNKKLEQEQIDQDCMASANDVDSEEEGFW